MLAVDVVVTEARCRLFETLNVAGLRVQVCVKQVDGKETDLADRVPLGFTQVFRGER